MLYIAAVAFGLGMLLFCANWWVSSAEMDLRWPATILIFIALALVLYDVCKKQPVPPEPVKAEAATTR